MAIHTFGEYLDFHPHLHSLVADGLFMRSGMFHVLAETGLKPLEELFRARVITFLVDKGLLPVERANMLRGWVHSGFNVHRSRRVLPDERKDDMSARCLKRRIKKPKGNIVRDDEVVLEGVLSRKKYPQRFRRITAWVEINGEQQLMMSFITNHMEWASSSICELYKCRWGIEAFFKQIKQTLQLSDFLGHSKNAIQWQVWTALLTHLLLRFLAFISQWGHSFVRIFTVLRGVLWSRFELSALLKSYGTAGGSFRMLSAPEQAYQPRFEFTYGTAHG